MSLVKVFFLGINAYYDSNSMYIYESRLCTEIVFKVLRVSVELILLEIRKMLHWI